MYSKLQISMQFTIINYVLIFKIKIDIHLLIISVSKIKIVIKNYISLKIFDEIEEKYD